MRGPAGEGGGGFGYAADVLGFTESAFTLLRDIIAQRTGVYFDAAKRDLLADRLTEILAARGMTSFLDYYYLLRYDADADGHWAELLDRLAVPETYFWRQPEQILALVDCVVPKYLSSHPGRPLRIWSAACCSGEEPLSIAIALAEAGLLDGPMEIVASDASASLVERARRGVYGERSFRNLPAHLRERYFTREDAGWRIDRRLHERVRWTTANLVDAASARPLASAEVIFCRNVFIYFSDENVAKVVRLFAEEIRAPGVLFLGASESLTRLTTPFELAEIGDAFAYVKRGALPATSY